MAFLFGALVGLALGLTGGGGSIFAVPMLAYGLGLPAHDAVSVSLMAVALTAAFGVADGARVGLIEYRAGLIFAAAGMLTAPLGVRAARLFSEAAILTAFAILMIVIAVSMWWRASRHPHAASIVRAGYLSNPDTGVGAVCRLAPDQPFGMTAACGVALALAGVVTGLLAGLFGVGGGFLIVPALTFVAGLDMHRAVATSLLVIALIGLSGSAAVVAEGRALPWGLVGLFVVGGIGGMMLGRLLARRIAGPRLQKMFAAAILLVAVFVLISRLP